MRTNAKAKADELLTTLNGEIKRLYTIKEHTTNPEMKLAMEAICAKYDKFYLELGKLWHSTLNSEEFNKALHTLDVTYVSAAEEEEREKKLLEELEKSVQKDAGSDDEDRL